MGSSYDSCHRVETPALLRLHAGFDVFGKAGHSVLPTFERLSVVSLHPSNSPSRDGLRLPHLEAGLPSTCLFLSYVGCTK